MAQRNRNKAVTVFVTLLLLFLAAEFWVPFQLMCGPQPCRVRSGSTLAA